jgi:hypothetical protein
MGPRAAQLKTKSVTEVLGASADEVAQIGLHEPDPIESPHVNREDNPMLCSVASVALKGSSPYTLRDQRVRTAG